MKKEGLLLTVEDHFQIDDRGLVVIPHYELDLESQQFEPFSDRAVVERPDGTKITIDVSFQLEHFDLVDGGYRWCITTVFPRGTKSEVPVGSRVFVTTETLQRVKGEIPNQSLQGSL